MSDLKHSLTLVDTLVLQDLIRATHAALADSAVVTRVSQETGMNEDRVTILSELASELLEAEGARPSISTDEEINIACNERARGKAGF